jgi:hypothetical protein
MHHPKTLSIAYAIFAAQVYSQVRRVHSSGRKRSVASKWQLTQKVQSSK